MADLGREDDKELEGLAGYAPELAAALAAIASDVALVIDDKGIIRNVAMGVGGMHPLLDEWVGRRWADTVTSETRRKIDLLLSEAQSAGVSKRREVNHLSGSGDDIPMTYAAIRLGENGPVLVAGRDLRAISAIQQRFVESQQELERSYWMQRQAEAHYRLLFQVATDAVLVVDACTHLIIDANPSAHSLLGAHGKAVLGRKVDTCMDPRSRCAVEDMLETARSTGKPAELKVRLSTDARAVVVSATPFRGEHDMLLLLRISLADTGHSSSAQADPAHDSHTLDPVVITDGSGRVVMVNPAFLDLVGVASETQLKDQSLSQWVAGFDQQLNSVLEKINRQGIAASSTSIVRHDTKQRVDVDLSAALMTGGEQVYIGISMRPCHGTVAAQRPIDHAFSQKIQSLASELGQLSLDELLARVGQLAEQHFITEALSQTDGNAPAAARLLGVHPARLRDLFARPGHEDDTDQNGPILH